MPRSVGKIPITTPHNISGATGSMYRGTALGHLIAIGSQKSTAPISSQFPRLTCTTAATMHSPVKSHPSRRNHGPTSLLPLGNSQISPVR